MIVNATAKFTPRDSSGRFINSKVTAGVLASVKAASDLILKEAQSIVPVDTGELRASGKTVIQQTDKSVIGHVVFDAEHAGYVEFGTGIRGASSAGAGPYSYNPNWMGMPAQPYLRPALDTTRDAVKGIFKSQIALEMKL